MGKETGKGVKDGTREAKRELAWSIIDEVSLVSQGDNPDADVLLLKQKKAEEEAAAKATKEASMWTRFKAWAGSVAKDYGMAPRTLDQIVVAREFEQEFSRLRWDFYESVDSILCCADPSQMAKLMEETSAQFTKRVKLLVDSLSGGSEAKAKELMDLLDKMQTETRALSEANGAAEKRAPLVATLETLKVFSFANAPLAAAQTEDEPMPVPADKSAPVDKMQEILDRMAKMDAERAKDQAELAETKKALADAQAKSNALQADVQKLTSEQGDALFSAKAKAFGIGDEVRLTKVIKTAFGVSAEAGKDLEEVLSALAAKARIHDTIVMQQRGLGFNATDGNADDGTLTGKLMSMAKTYHTAHPEKSFEVCKFEVLQANPTMKKALLDEESAARKNARH